MASPTTAVKIYLVISYALLLIASKAREPIKTWSGAAKTLTLNVQVDRPKIHGLLIRRKNECLSIVASPLLIL